jgi:hypothetical protein
MCSWWCRRNGPPDRPERTIDRILIRQAVLVSDTTLAIELADQDTKIVRRTTSSPPRGIKGKRPRTATSVF